MWIQNTPYIYDEHKAQDKKLHQPKTQQTFVSIKRVGPRLPCIKDLITPFMTEAIDEQLQEQEMIKHMDLSQMKQDSTDSTMNPNAVYNRWPDKKETMNVENHFNIKSEERTIGVKSDSIVDEDAGEVELEI